MVCRSMVLLVLLPHFEDAAAERRLMEGRHGFPGELHGGPPDLLLGG